MTDVQMKAALNFEHMLLWRRPHPSLQAKSSCLNSPCNGDVFAMIENQIYVIAHYARVLLRYSHYGGVAVVSY